MTKAYCSLYVKLYVKYMRKKIGKLYKQYKYCITALMPQNFTRIVSARWYYDYKMEDRCKITCFFSFH